jgi:hypothetical protein
MIILVFFSVDLLGGSKVFSDPSDGTFSFKLDPIVGKPDKMRRTRIREGTICEFLKAITPATLDRSSIHSYVNIKPLPSMISYSYNI